MSEATEPNQTLDRPAAIRAGEELDLPKLAAYLHKRFPAEQGELSVSQYPSGHSNLTYAVRLGAREFVLRRPPFGSKVKSAHDMGREYRVLSKLHAVFAPAPEVLDFCDDPEVLGAPFYLMQPIHGVILRSRMPRGLSFPPESARGLSEAFVDNLVRLHAVDYAAAGLADLGKPEGYLERQVRGWTERYYGSKTHELPVVEKITAWMQANLPETKYVSLLHNDYKYDNVILDSADLTRIIGLLDWEMCTIGDSLADLGTALAYWVNETDPPEVKAQSWGPTAYPGSYSRAQVVERYARQTGRDCSAMPFYLVFARFKLAVIVQQIYYRFHQGLTQDQRFAAMPLTIEALLGASWHCARTGEL